MFVVTVSTTSYLFASQASAALFAKFCTPEGAADQVAVVETEAAQSRLSIGLAAVRDQMVADFTAKYGDDIAADTLTAVFTRFIQRSLENPAQTQFTWADAFEAMRMKSVPLWSAYVAPEGQVDEFNTRAQGYSAAVRACLLPEIPQRELGYLTKVFEGANFIGGRVYRQVKNQPSGVWGWTSEALLKKEGRIEPTPCDARIEAAPVAAPAPVAPAAPAEPAKAEAGPADAPAPVAAPVAPAPVAAPKAVAAFFIVFSQNGKEIARVPIDAEFKQVEA